MNDLKAYRPDRPYKQQAFEVFAAVAAIIILVCMGLYLIFSIGGPAIDDRDAFLQERADKILNQGGYHE